LPAVDPARYNGESSRVSNGVMQMPRVVHGGRKQDKRFGTNGAVR
jgi:hypothetical protein